MTLTFYPLRAMVMIYSRAKVQGQRSIGSEDRVKTNGPDGGDHITSHANAVGNDCRLDARHITTLYIRCAMGSKSKSQFASVATI